MKFDIVCFCAGVSVGALLVGLLGNSLFYFTTKWLGRGKR